MKRDKGDTVVEPDSNSKPLLTVQEIGELGFDLALFGVTPLQTVVGALESTAKEFLGTNKDRPGTGIIGFNESEDSSQITMADFATVKDIVGFGELQGFESGFPCS